TTLAFYKSATAPFCNCAPRPPPGPLHSAAAVGLGRPPRLVHLTLGRLQQLIEIRMLDTIRKTVPTGQVGEITCAARLISLRPMPYACCQGTLAIGSGDQPCVRAQ